MALQLNTPMIQNSHLLPRSELISHCIKQLILFDG